MKNILLTALSLLFLTSAASSADQEKALDVSATRAFENLVFDRPIVVTHADDGSNRVFVAEQKGVLQVFPNDPDVEEIPEDFFIKDQIVVGP